MKRLTVKSFAWKGTSNFRNIGRWNLAECLNRLSEYEDTGLTPDEINALRERDTAKEPEEIRDAFGDGRLICPNCRNSVINYFNRSRPPRFCMICGQRLQWEE